MLRWLAPSILDSTINPYIFTYINFFTVVYIATACEHANANLVTSAIKRWLDN